MDTTCPMRLTSESVRLGSVREDPRALRGARIGKRSMRGARRWLDSTIPWVLALIVGACAGVPRDASLPINDPAEDMNRHVMSANQELLRPAVELVRAIPGPI